jgi:pimeloyl-ACP methyl ester carboxylesterase
VRTPELQAISDLIPFSIFFVVCGCVSELKRHFQNPSSRSYSLRQHLRGVVFDSAPALYPQAAEGSFNPLSALYHALRGAVGFSFPSVAIVLGRAQYVHPFWTPAITLWVIGFKAALMLKKMLMGREKKPSSSGGGADFDPVGSTRRHLEVGLQTNVPRVPHLFLYSSADKLLPHSFIESYAAFVRQQLQATDGAGGAELVQMHDFKSTGHVQHFLRRKDEYTRLLRAFLDRLPLPPVQS